ncbi:MAG: DUF697 domain-containing protein, partial [Saprospiraceae bacterium]
MLDKGKKAYDFIKKVNSATKKKRKMSSEKDSGRSNHADTIVRNHVIWSMGAGMIPILIADIFAVSALQLDMIRQLCRVYDVDFEETQGKALVTSLTSSALARIGAGSVIKLIPGIGSFIGGATVSIFAGASTYALGEVFKKHFASGGTILDFDPDRLRKMYKEKFEKGKKVAKEWNKDAKSDQGDNFSVPVEKETAPPKAAKDDSAKAEKEVAVKKKSVADATEEIMDKLKKLAELKDAGIITEKEFTQMKQRILDKF